MQSYPGEAKTFIELAGSTNGSFEYNDAVLKEILQNSLVKDRKIAIISITGAFRRGKSFLLDYFLRYLYTNFKSVGSPSKPFRQGTSSSWLGDAEEPLQGFSWRSGVQRNTTGIVIWSDVFLHDSENGEKIALVLLDTQGLFDNKSTSADNSRIFSLSTLMSSMQIFNLSNQIQEDHLNYLQFATEYARLAASNNDSSQPKSFQYLMFLVRDWNFPDEYCFGSSCGKALLEKILKVEPDQQPELKSLREYIHASFEELSCFLFPHPGKIVATSSKYDGRWSKIDEDFVDQLKHLVVELFSTESLVLKKINGDFLLAGEIPTLISQYVELFKSDRLPAPLSIYETTIQNHMQGVIGKCVGLYNEKVEEGKVSLENLTAIETLHQSAKQEAIKMFQGARKMGGGSHHTKYQTIMENEIEKNLTEWENIAKQDIERKLESARSLEEMKKEQERAAQAILAAQKAQEEVERLRLQKIEDDRVAAVALQELKEAQARAEAERIAAIQRQQEAERLAAIERQRQIERQRELDRLQEQARQEAEANRIRVLELERLAAENQRRIEEEQRRIDEENRRRADEDIRSRIEQEAKRIGNQIKNLPNKCVIS